MMEYFLKTAAIAVAAAILTCFLKKENSSFSLLLSVSAGMLIVFLLANILQPIVDFFLDLTELSGVGRTYVEPVLKCTGIGILTQIAAAVCRDAGESSLAGLIELGGCGAALVLALPLFTAVLQMITELMGG